MKIIFKADNYPIFQNVLYNTSNEAKLCKKSQIEIIQDDKTGLIYNNKFDNKIIEYNSEYHNEQQYSKKFNEHLYTVASYIIKYFSNKNILEIGSGDGYFLEILEKYGLNICGMDPSYCGDNKNIKKEYFKNGDYSNYNAIIMRHVLEHIQNPYDFLYKLKNSFNKDVLIYIEVPDLEYINNNCTFFDLYYEHVNYFRIEDFKNMFDNILYIDKSFGNQYISLVAELNSLKLPEKKTDFKLNNNFFDKFYNCIDIIKNSKGKNVIWGCSSKGVIFSILLNNSNVKVDYFVDINSYKQNKYIPIISNESGYGKIQSFKEIKHHLNNESIIFIMNENYKEEIIDITDNNYKYITF